MQVHCFENPAEQVSYAQMRVLPWQEPLIKSLILLATLAIMLFVMSLAIFLVVTRPAYQIEQESSGSNGGGPAFAEALAPDLSNYNNFQDANFMRGVEHVIS